MLYRSLQIAAFSISGLAAQPVWADVAAEPAMITLSTGSRLATWTLPGSGTSRRTPVIFLHGGPGGFITTGVMDKSASLRSAGFSTVYFDQAGGGQSGRIPAAEFTLARAVDDLEALRIELKAERVILWGSSYGADLAVLYERRFPDRVAALIFTSPASFPGTRPKYDYRSTDDRSIPPGKRLMQAARLIDRIGGAAEATLSQEEAGKLFDADLNSGAYEGRMLCKKVSAAPIGAITEPTEAVTGGNLYANRMLLKELKGLAPIATAAPIPPRPAIIIRGACDFMPLSNAERYRVVYGGSLVTIPNSGHGLRENPADLGNALSQFALGPLSGVE